MKRRWLFVTGTQYLDWVYNECRLCRYYSPNRPIGMGCPVEEEVAKAYVFGLDKVLDYRFDVHRQVWVYDPGWSRRIAGRKATGVKVKGGRGGKR